MNTGPVVLRQRIKYREAAKFMGCTTRTLERREADGSVPRSHKLGKPGHEQRFFYVDELLRWEAAQLARPPVLRSIHARSRGQLGKQAE